MPKIIAMTSAEKRSKKLLYSFLDKKQKRQLAAHGWFEITASDGKTYEVGDVYGFKLSYVRRRREWLGCPCCTHRKIDTILDARPYIIKSDYNWTYYPIFDQMLHQMLALQTDAKKFIRTACKS